MIIIFSAVKIIIKNDFKTIFFINMGQSFADKLVSSDRFLGHYFVEIIFMFCLNLWPTNCWLAHVKLLLIVES